MITTARKCYLMDLTNRPQCVVMNTNTILPQQTNLKHVGVNDVMTEYYEISHSSIQSEEVLYH